MELENEEEDDLLSCDGRKADRCEDKLDRKTVVREKARKGL